MRSDEFWKFFPRTNEKVTAFDVEHILDLNHQLAGRGAPDLERLYTVARFECLAGSI